MAQLFPTLSSPAVLDKRFAELGYLADEGLAIAMFLALQLGKPLLLEGAMCATRVLCQG